MMAFYHGNDSDKSDYRQREDEDFSSTMYRLEHSRAGSPRLEHEKKIRREIANSNERRRMQSINAGFQSLRALLPKGEGDKLSKAAILQGTVDYVQKLEHEKTFLLSQNIKLTRSVQSSNDSDGSCSDLPLPKRKRRKTELVSHLLDEGIGSASPSSQSENEDVRHEIAQLRRQLERERSWRLRLEDELKEREARLSRSEPVDHDYTEHEVMRKSPSNINQDNLPPTSASLGDSVTPQPSHILEHSRTIRPSPKSNPAHTDKRCFSGTTAAAQPSYPAEYVNPQPYATTTIRPRQNLAAIVEAIRHVEGFHMFQDDPPSLNLTTSAKQENASDDGRSFESQIIRSAPVVQNRAGVIVSNTS